LYLGAEPPASIEFARIPSLKEGLQGSI